MVILEEYIYLGPTERRCKHLYFLKLQWLGVQLTGSVSIVHGASDSVPSDKKNKAKKTFIVGLLHSSVEGWG